MNILNNLSIIKSKTFYLFSMALILMPISQMNQVFYWGVLLTVPIVLLASKLNFKSNTSENKFLLLFFLSVLIMGISLVFSVDYSNPLKVFVHYISIFLTLYILNASVFSRYKLIIILHSFIFTALLISLFLTYFIYKNGTIFIDFDEIDSFGKNSTSPILFVGFCSSVLLCEIAFNKIYKYLVHYFLIMIMLTLSLKVIISSLFIVALIFFLRFSIKVVFRTVLILSISVIFILNANFDSLLGNPSISRTIDKISFIFGVENTLVVSHYSTDYRESLARDGIEIFISNPLIGIGMENTRLFLPTYTHNTFVELLAGGGFFLGFSFILMIFVAFSKAISVNLLSLRLLILSILCTVVFVSLGQRLYDNRFLMLLLFTGIKFSSLYKNYTRKEQGKIKL